MRDAREIIKTVKRIEIRTRMLVEGLIQGNYHSVFKGRGIEFNEVREYVPGDDIRAIDWNVTARMDAPFVKEFIEERDLTVYILFDASGSGDFGDEKEKKEAQAEIAATLMFAAIRNNDRVGLGIFTDKVERFIPSRKGKKHAMKLLAEMLGHEPRSRKTDIGQALRFFSGAVKKRSILFIISDFQDKGYEKQLAYCSRKHDTVMVQVADDRESEIPDVGYILLEDEETGEQVLVDTSDEGFRSSFHVSSLREQRAVLRAAMNASCDLVTIGAGEDLALPLRRFFSKRMRSRR